MSHLQRTINDLLTLDGAVGAAIVDTASGMALATAGTPGFDLDVAASGSANVVRTAVRALADLAAAHEPDDVVVTAGGRQHLLALLGSAPFKGLFVYLVLDRAADLDAARQRVAAIAAPARVA